jgi:hypothetical protein
MTRGHASAVQAALYYMRKRNRMGRPPLDTAPLGSAIYIGNWGGTPTPVAATTEAGDVRVLADGITVRVTADGRIRVLA